ncbi:MAG: hypothetical protein AB8H03_14790 [Saprospiraceae bacterium]
MEKIIEILNIDADKNRLFFSFFCLLIAVMLFYFWVISKEKKGAKVKHGEGLIFIAMAYGLYFAIGIVSLFIIDYDEPTAKIYFVLSGLISMCYFLSLPFFSLSSHAVDKIVESHYWKNGIYLFGFIWLIFFSSMESAAWMNYYDWIIGVAAMILMGFFITRYLVRRGLKLLGLIAIIFFLIVIALEVWPSSQGKFEHMNTYMLGPALTLSVVVLSFTFNWINELSFYELADIWVGEENASEKKIGEFAKLTVEDNKQTWMKKIAKDDIEKVIEEIIILKKHKNQDLEMILNIASRNTRNNNNKLKDIISYEDYQLSRNKVIDSLIKIIN